MESVRSGRCCCLSFPGTAVGAALGGSDRGVTGVVVGGAAGATTGTTAAGTTHDKGAAIPNEAVLTFTVQ